MRANRCAVVPAGGSDKPDCCGTFGRLAARKVDDKASRIPVCPGRSRIALELGIGRFIECGWIASILRLGFVQQTSQSRPRSRIAHDSLPGRVAIQFRKKKRQGDGEFLSFGRG